jgi:hypothetical protein
MKLKDRLAKLEDYQKPEWHENHIILGSYYLTREQAFDKYQEQRTNMDFTPRSGWAALKHDFLSENQSTNVLFVYIEVVSPEF